MHLFIHKGRNIVVAKDAAPEEGTVRVAWLGLNPKLEGTAKRGRHPNYTRGVPAKELEPLATSDVSDTLLADAEKHLAMWDATPAAATTDSTESTSDTTVS